MINVPVVIAAGTIGAFISGLIGFLSLIISKDQKVSEFRQLWIDGLRKDVSIFISYIYAKVGLQVKGVIEDSTEDSQIISSDIFHASKAASRIRLRLNRKENESDSILKKISKIEELSSFGLIPDTDEIVSEVNELVQLTQDLLKNEWKRVKRGELTYLIAKWLAIVFLICAMIIPFILHHKGVLNFV
ncbi:MAG: hypothetical protein F4234_11815 [Gammaproteobacteria bacterium]|nr:hypothetical protein [Gammaproteobacteria bacterium]MYF00833.1 hypothetical protein [Gammaproteobacteria bacterium]MYH46128.1 hypothetical protein [Gammaproteobacteria bacterium]MYL14694.1 hypothetical protein [Gammaproteobacteria bacterium]